LEGGPGRQVGRQGAVIQLRHLQDSEAVAEGVTTDLVAALQGRLAGAPEVAPERLRVLDVPRVRQRAHSARPRQRAATTSASSVPFPHCARRSSAIRCGAASRATRWAKSLRMPSVAKITVSPGERLNSLAWIAGSLTPTTPLRRSSEWSPSSDSWLPRSSTPSTLPTP